MSPQIPKPLFEILAAYAEPPVLVCVANYAPDSLGSGFLGEDLDLVNVVWVHHGDLLRTPAHARNLGAPHFSFLPFP